MNFAACWAVSKQITSSVNWWVLVVKTHDYLFLENYNTVQATVIRLVGACN